MQYARGYDFYTPNGGSSIKTYNSTTNTWDGIDNGSTNTSALPIANKKGYMIFVRGDRSVQTSAAAATVTTLRTRGRIYSPGADVPAIYNSSSRQTRIGRVILMPLRSISLTCNQHQRVLIPSFMYGILCCLVFMDTAAIKPSVV
ncbi:MAG: hypothetical protein V9E88_15225 [Ferruginibacter sp.]